MSSAGSNQACPSATFCALSPGLGSIATTQDGYFPAQPPSPQHASSAAAMTPSLTMPATVHAQGHVSFGTSPTNRGTSKAATQHTPSFGFNQTEASPGPQSSPRTPSKTSASKLRSAVHAVQIVNRFGNYLGNPSASSSSSSSTNTGNSKAAATTAAAPRQPHGSPMTATRTVQSQAPMLPMCPTRTAPACYVQPEATPKAAAPSPTIDQPAHESHFLDRVFGVGDMLFVRGTGGGYGLMDIGAAGGWLGHVMVVAETPTKITRDSEDFDAFHRIWPAGAKEIYLVKCVESTRARTGLSEQRFLFHVLKKTGKFVLIGEVDYETHTIALSGEDMEMWQAPTELRKRMQQHKGIAEEVLAVMKKMWANWSWHTAFRSVVSQSHLATFRDRDDVLSKVEELWDREPICTSVMITFWQRCLAKLADTGDSPDDMADLILKYMPLKTDRTLPGILLSCMEKHGWKRLEQPSEKAVTFMMFQEAQQTHANPRYCSQHDTSAKRPKSTGPMDKNCHHCGINLKTTYAQFSYCHVCSEELESCCICKAHVPKSGTYKPRAVMSSAVGTHEPFQPVIRPPDEEGDDGGSSTEAVPAVAIISQPASVQVPISVAPTDSEPFHNDYSHQSYQSYQSSNGGSTTVPATAGLGAAAAVIAAIPSSSAGASAAVSVGSLAYPPMEAPPPPQHSPRHPPTAAAAGDIVVGRSMTVPVGNAASGSANPRHCRNHDETGKRPKAQMGRNVVCKGCQQTFLCCYAEFVYCPACSDACEACMNCGAPAPPGKARGGVSCVPIRGTALAPARPAAVSNFC